MSALLTISAKVFVMLILIFVGYILTKKAVLTDKGMSEITALLLWFVTPCLIVNSLIDSQGSIEIGEMGLAALLPALAMGISIVLSFLFFRKETDERRTVLRFSTIFNNVGFMGIPLVQGIVGERGVVYASFTVLVFNVISWTFGFKMMNSNAKLTAKTVLLNPGMIGMAIGLPLYFLNVSVPVIIKEPIEMLSAVNTPLAMIVIGSFVAKVDMKSFVSDLSVYKMSALRLIAAPALFLGVLMLIKPESDLFVTSIILAATPVAANTVLFAVQFKKDSHLASKTVAVSTILSVITIPLFTILGQFVSEWLYGVI